MKPLASLNRASKGRNIFSGLAGFATATVGAGLCAMAMAQDVEPTEPFAHVSCRGEPFEIRVTVHRVKKGVGLMTADLYPDDAEKFLRSVSSLSKVRFAAKAPETQFCVYAPEAGDYAVSVYHYKNANKKFDKGAFGIPVESFGLSRNPKLRFSAPPIEKTLFAVPEEGVDITIKLRN